MIQGKKEIIERVKKAKPGDPAVYVNMDAIEQLPDEYESTIVEVDFDINRDFANINEGTKKEPVYYPLVPFMNRIAEKRGIVGYGDSIVEALYEEVNISLMEMMDEPKIMKMKVGYIVKKRAAVMMEDGIFKPTEWRAGMYNAWEEANNLWSKEEMYTEGYTKPPKYPPNKYDTKWKRRYHFRQEMDKALGIAESTSWSICIREITGMLTGYKPEYLTEGKFYFAKIRRSKLAIKAETAARLTALSSGKQIESQPQEMLFGPDAQAGQEPVPHEQAMQQSPIEFPTIEPEPVKQEPPPPAPKWEQYIAVVDGYRKENIIPEDAKSALIGAYNWIKKMQDEAETDTGGKWWNQAVQILKTLENVIPEVGRAEHTIY
jgi:hypothetical protein